MHSWTRRLVALTGTATLSMLAVASVAVVLVAAPVRDRPTSTASALQVLSDASGTRCAEPVHPPLPLDSPPSVVPEVESPDDTVVRDVGVDRGAVTLTTTLPLSEPLPRGVDDLNVSIGQFRRLDGRALEPGQVTARAHVAPAGRRRSIDLVVCLDPVVVDTTGRRLIEAHAGSYTGTVLIDDPRVVGGGVTYTLNMRFATESAVYGLVVVAWMIGAAGGVGLASGLSLTSLRSMFRTGSTRVRAFTALASSLAAAFTVLNAQYLRDPSWQGDSALMTTLFVSTVGATYAAANLAGSVQLGQATPAVPRSTPGTTV